MPCQGPSDAECRGADARVAVAKHIVFFMTELGLKDEIPQEVLATIEHQGWGRESADIDYLTRTLCNEIQSTSIHDAHQIIYNSRSRKSRDLANWWEDHQEQDRAREEKERAEEEHEAERQRILNKLSPYERAVLFPNDR